jgi:MFS family permease
MRDIFSTVGALLISAAILLAGGGLLGTLVSVRAQIEGFPLPVIGLLMSAYYLGFAVGCFATPYVVARVGHIRSFGAFAALTAAASLCYVLTLNIPMWLLLRLITGFSFAALYMIIESWINEKSTNETRGQVLSVYRAVDLVAITVGQFMLTWADPAGFVLFSLVALCICISIIPVSLTVAMAPEPLTKTSLNLKKLIRVSPLAVLGALSVGLANGAFWGISPIFVQELGYDLFMVALFISAAIISGALAQVPIGWVSDRMDRRIVLIFVGGASAASGIFLCLLAPVSQFFLLAGGCLYGMFGMSLFGLAAAHANDHAETDEFVAISGGLLLIYGIGAVLGPVLAPLVMHFTSPSYMFAYTAAIHAALFVFGLYRLTRRDSLPVEDQEDFIPAGPRTTPVIFEIDPRSMGEEE